MDREKLLQNPLPINRDALRVTRKARPEDLWRPMPRDAAHHPPIDAVLETAPIPIAGRMSNPWMANVIGCRRGRMRVIGYAADQSGAAGQTSPRWVVRCDCGNYAYRSRILRWLRTQAPDMCHECQKRIYLTQGRQPSLDKAERMPKLTDDKNLA